MKNRHYFDFVILKSGCFFFVCFLFLPYCEIMETKVEIMANGADRVKTADALRLNCFDSKRNCVVFEGS